MSHQKEPGLPPMSHDFLLVAGLAAAWFAQAAIAGCPPGYLAKAGHCIPGHAQSRHPPVIESTPHASVGVSPVDASRSDVRIPQPISLGKSALNPQPIPPGHVLRKLSPPHADTPVDQTPHWDLKANKAS